MALFAVVGLQGSFGCLNSFVSLLGGQIDLSARSKFCSLWISRLKEALTTGTNYESCPLQNLNAGDPINIFDWCETVVRVQIFKQRCFALKYCSLIYYLSLLFIP